MAKHTAEIPVEAMVQLYDPGYDWPVRIRLPDGSPPIKRGGTFTLSWDVDQGEARATYEVDDSDESNVALA